MATAHPAPYTLPASAPAPAPLRAPNTLDDDDDADDAALPPSDDDAPLPFALPGVRVASASAPTSSAPSPAPSSLASFVQPPPAPADGGTPLTPLTPAGLGARGASGRVGRTRGSSEARRASSAEEGREDEEQGREKDDAQNGGRAPDGAHSPRSDRSLASGSSNPASATSGGSAYRAPAGAALQAGAPTRRRTRASTAAAAGTGEEEIADDGAPRAAKRREMVSPARDAGAPERALPPASVAGPSSNGCSPVAGPSKWDSAPPAPSSLDRPTDALNLLADLASSSGPVPTAPAPAPAPLTGTPWDWFPPTSPPSSAFTKASGAVDGPAVMAEFDRLVAAGKTDEAKRLVVGAARAMQPWVPSEPAPAPEPAPALVSINGMGKGKGKERATSVEPERAAEREMGPAEREARRKREEAEELELAKQGAFGWILQDVPCSSRKVSHPLQGVLSTHRCQACTSRQPGHICAFLGIRSFPLSPTRRALPFPAIRDAGSSATDDAPRFPTQFDAPFTLPAAALLKSAAATHLAPTLRIELAHAQREGCARIRRQLETTHTCDGCNAAVLYGSWMCRTCGREYCLECGAALALSSSSSQGDGANPNARDKLTRCRGKYARHTPADLVPLTRIPAAELSRTLRAMDAWRAANPLPVPAALPREWVDAHRVPSGEKEEGHPVIRVSAALIPPRMDEEARVKLEAAPGAGEEPPEEGVRVPPADASAGGALSEADAALLSATNLLPLFSSSALPAYASLEPPLPSLTHEALFRALWALGEPLLLDLSPPSVPLLPWTPAFLAYAYGLQRCRVGNNRVDAGGERETTVEEFFGAFGRRGGERSASEKIKDWPSAKDFKDEYPDLWHDFMDVLPAGSITRRDGVLNISAHTPRNANPPDLGPKGYFSEISEDGPGGKGSTKLHSPGALAPSMTPVATVDADLLNPDLGAQDVADAVNVMLWASDAPDGGPGVAIWDLYRAEDADKIRDFLYGHIARLEGWADAAEARARVDDPIHTQKFFLDSSLRAALLASHGVRSFRVHQRPGQAVFIPAGCAHQVCNMADCIKVATDFVSVENVARCWKVTDEFRAQTKDKVLWRSDVLQLKSMLLWAWHSAERIDPSPDLDGEEEDRGVPAPPPVTAGTNGAARPDGATDMNGAARGGERTDVDLKEEGALEA
ncbi:hypothetical protein JCM10449v2_007530 [Rhodotorula kratochvilovae]